MRFEWLPMSLPWELSLDNPEYFDPPVYLLKVSRSNDLSLTVSAVADGHSVAPDDHRAPRGLIKGDTLLLRTIGQKPVTMEGYYTSNTNTNANHRANSVHTRIDGQAWKVTSRYLDGTPFSVTEWLSNAPDRTWPRLTKREEKTTWDRKRGEGSITSTSTGSHSSRDHIQIALGRPKLESVLFGVVSADCSKADVVKPGFLEFRAGKDGLPDESTRHAVRRALEFLFGSQLAVVGWSEFDENGVVLSAALTSAPTTAGGPALPPGLLHPRFLDGVDEAIILQFLRKYLELEEVYDLDRAVWLFLHAQSAPLDMKAAYVGAAFEVLRRGYYARPENEDRSRRLPKDRWKKINKNIGELLSGLAATDEWMAVSDELQAVKSRVGNLNEISGSKLNSLFLDDLGLEHSVIESDALQARNDAAHANRLGPDDYASTLRHYRALHTLFARCLFSLMEVDTAYIDYSSLEHPHRPLPTMQGVPSSR